MQIFVPRENEPGETRVAIVPETVEKLTKLGAKVEIEAGLGDPIGQSDGDYEAKGASVSPDRAASLANADMVLRMSKPPADEVAILKKGCIHISFLDPFNEKDLIQAFCGAGASAISLEMIPRTTIAQKMDALSSQANLGGYAAMIVAAEKTDKIFPMMMTPAGTLPPSRVFVIGAGVAGLQAIATAKRLGARVEAFDTRPVVKEQVESLGAKFVEVDLGDTGQTTEGYAKELTEDQLQKQRDAMAKRCAAADVVVTTAQVFGRKAPRIVTDAMIREMRPGSIIVDMAVGTGGNVEGSKPDEEVCVHGVRIIGLTNLPGQVASHASLMFSSNLYNLIAHFWEEEKSAFNIESDDEILKGCLITHRGGLVNETIRNLTA